MYTFLLAIIGVTCGWFMQVGVLGLITILALLLFILVFKYENDYYPFSLLDILTEEKFYKLWLMLTVMWSTYLIVVYKKPLLEFAYSYILR